MVIMMVKAIAQPKFLILNPSTNSSTNFTKSALTTNANKPKVMIVNGRAKKWRMGPKRKLASEIPAATQTALQKFFISTPLNTFAVIKTDTLFISQAQIIMMEFC